MKHHILYILLRRLRMPLITLIVVYAVSVLGLVLIPGIDNEGNPWRMDFFHAFYFVSFMGSTIGFGEVPYEFTDAQRFWTLFTIYATVIAWLYGIGKLLAVFQDPGFQRLLQRSAFCREVSGIREPFYLICGYGVTGSLVVQRLASRGLRAVVIDIDQGRLDELETAELNYEVPGLCADASEPKVLRDAGLESPYCAGVLALTNQDTVNLAIAIASKLLAAKRPVISRTESALTTANLASFGTDHIIDPFTTYADYLALALHAPYKHLVYDWLTNPRHRSLASLSKPIQGRWVICGYGRFGSALYQSFKQQPVSLTIIDPNPKSVEMECDFVQGLGTEAVTLEQAQIREAVGLIAGTHDDANNLSIVMTARELNPRLFTVARQNHRSNAPVFDAAKSDLIMEPGRIIANNILALIKTPLLQKFLDELRAKDDVWAHTLVNRMSSVAGERELDSWAIRVSEEEAPALCEMLERGKTLQLRLFCKDPQDLTRNLSAFPLLLKRGDRVDLLPGELNEIALGDEILFCGLSHAADRMRWTVFNNNVLSHVLNDREHVRGWLARWFKQRAAVKE